MSPLNLDRLRRYPDIEAPDLVAVDAADRLLLDTAADSVRRGHVAVINDSYGALTLGSADETVQLPIRVFQDGIVNERALASNASDAGMAGTYRALPLDAELLGGVSTVLLRLPRSLDELDEIASMIARHAAPDVQVFAGGRLKHMSLTMNDVLGRYFDHVTAGLARQKARVLTASARREELPPVFPRSARHDVGLSRPLELRAFGATFGGAALDPGTRLLLPHLRSMEMPTADGQHEVIDLGCGNGAISAFLALAHPEIRILASDQSASAVAATRATAAANGVSGRIRVSRDDALSALPDRSVQLIVLNPPFHIGSTVHTGIATKLFDACARVLVPGGQLYTVWNSHLRYRPVLERMIGPTRQLDRSPKFTVTSSRRS